jgi:methionyl aminopeptidase
MIKLKNRAEIERIRAASRILTETLRELVRIIDDGITTLDLDRAARSCIENRGGKPAFLGYLDFPAAICISVNEEVIHGIPGKRRLRRGDIISLDLGVDLGGYFSDAAVTVGVGDISPERETLVRVTRECLEHGIAQAVAGNRISDISRAVQGHARANGLEVVRQFCGHGVGFSQHEDPQIPNYVSSGPNPRLKTGMVLAIEPMINAGTWEVTVQADNWTVVTADRLDSAHFEHTIAVMDDHPEILTAFDPKDRL